MIRTFTLFLVLVVVTSPAHAYVGFGPGLGMLGSMLALLGSIFLALFMVIAYPLRLFLRRRKNQRKEATPRKSECA